MKSIFVTVALLAATAAHAGTSSDVTTSTTAAAGATNAGNAQSINFINPGNTDQTLRSAPTVYAPNPITPYTSASCVYAPSGGLSVIGFGVSGAVPIDGETCNWRLSQQGVQATAAGLRDLAISGFKGMPPAPALQPTDGESMVELIKRESAAANAATLLQKSADLMGVATDMQCLNSDRQRAVMERMGFCQNVKDLATLDHRFNQPRNYQIDYSESPAK